MPGPDAPAPLTPAPLSSGQVLSRRYRLVRPIARGGMADVWEGHDQILSRDVAIKVLQQQYATDQVFLERFRREAVAAARLVHPAVVATFDAGVDGGTTYIVMELVRGDTLRQFLSQRGYLPPWMAIGITSQMADALVVAHRAGIIHRDIKPANILLCADGPFSDARDALPRVKVTDFGIAKAAESLGMDLTRTGMVLGTPRYLSPEQVQGIEPDARADLYALGVVTFEMLTGRSPFEGETEMAMALARLNQPAPRARSLRPDVPRAVDSLVADLLATKPERRVPSAVALRQALDGVQASLPGSRTRSKRGNTLGAGMAGGSVTPGGRGRRLGVRRKPLPASSAPPGPLPTRGPARAAPAVYPAWPSGAPTPGPAPQATSGPPEPRTQSEYPSVRLGAGGPGRDSGARTTADTGSQGAGRPAAWDANHRDLAVPGPRQTGSARPAARPPGVDPRAQTSVNPADPRADSRARTSVNPADPRARTSVAPAESAMRTSVASANPAMPKVGDYLTPGPKRKAKRRSARGPGAVVAVLVVAAVVVAVLLVGGHRGGLTPGGTTSPPPSIAGVTVWIVPPMKSPDHPEEVRNTYDGNPGTFWSTVTYFGGRNFSGLGGEGLAIHLTASSALHQLAVTSGTTGWAASTYVSGAEASTLAGWGAPTAQHGNINGSTTFDLGRHAGNWVLLWMTDTGPKLTLQINELKVS